MTQRRKCDACNGCGYIEVGAGLNVLEAMYPDLPIREMEQRGWFGDVGDGEDVERCDAAFLSFWNADSHEQLRAAWKEGRCAPDGPFVKRRLA